MRGEQETMSSLMEPVILSESEKTQATRLIHVMQTASFAQSGFQLRTPDGVVVDLPPSVLPLFFQMVDTLRQGKALTIVPYDLTVTTQQAADLLNVSREYVIQLLDRHELPYERVDGHRRIALRHVVAYHHRMSEARRHHLAALTQLSDELGLYD